MNEDVEKCILRFTAREAELKEMRTLGWLRQPLVMGCNKEIIAILSKSLLRFGRICILPMRGVNKINKSQKPLAIPLVLMRQPLVKVHQTINPTMSTVQ
jgi:hypothetical protein